MTEKKTRDTLNLNDILNMLDSLQEKHTNLLNDMQGYFGGSSTLRTNRKTEPITPPLFSELNIPDLDILTIAKPNAFTNETDLLLKPPAPTEKFKPLSLDEVNLKHMARQILPDEQIEPPESENDFHMQESRADDTNNSLRIGANETAPTGALPYFPDVGIFDPPEPKKRKKIATTKSGKPKSKVHRFISATIFYGLIACLITGAFLISQGNKKSIFGYYFMNVLTWSMESEIPQGSLVVVKHIDTDTIEIGNDITYMKDKNTSVTHRVIGITENYDNSGERGFETQGIENDKPDFNIVPATNVVGVVKFHIPKLGNWLEWLRTNLIIALVFTAGFILLIVFTKGALKKSPKESKQPRKEIRQL